MDFAARVAAEPASVTQADAEDLRRHGLSDVDIFQVVLAACVRRFFRSRSPALTATADHVVQDQGRRAVRDEDRWQGHRFIPYGARGSLYAIGVQGSSNTREG